MAQHILIVEDEIAIRTMLTEVLEDEGYTVAAAANVDAGWSLLQTTRPNLILCDLMMPRRTGREFYQHLRNAAQYAGIPIIFMTALQPTQADERLIGDLQHVPVLYKPISIPELLTVVEMFIASGEQ